MRSAMASGESAIAGRVRRIVAAHQGVDADGIADDTPLFRNLASLDIEELIMAFEDEFGCKISNADATDFHTVGDVIRYLEKKRQTMELSPRK